MKVAPNVCPARFTKPRPPLPDGPPPTTFFAGQRDPPLRHFLGETPPPYIIFLVEDPPSYNIFFGGIIIEAFVYAPLGQETRDSKFTVVVHMF